MSKKPVMAVASAVAILFCIWLIWPSGRKVSRRELRRPYVCDACGHRFKAVPGTERIRCPKCGKTEAVLYHEYECRQCGERFEAFRERQAGAEGGPPSADEPPLMEYKKPDGEWVTSAEALGDIQCPHCGSTNAGPPKPGK